MAYSKPSPPARIRWAPPARAGVLRLVIQSLAALVLIFAPPAFASVDDLGASESAPAGQYVAEAAQRFGIPEGWIWAVMRVESAGRVTARSPVGAMGLMQIMPATWQSLRARYGLGSNPYDPRDNIMAGAAYLRDMHDRYGAYGMLAAYNAGPGRYEDYRSSGRPLPSETVAYVAKLLPMIGSQGAMSSLPEQPVAAPSWTAASLFIARTTSQPPASSAAEPTAVSRAASALFVPLSGQNRQ